MKLTTADYKGETIREVIESLENDANVMEFMSAQNLPMGDVLEAIATTMVFEDPSTVEVDTEGNVR